MSQYSIVRLENFRTNQNPQTQRRRLGAPTALTDTLIANAKAYQEALVYLDQNFISEMAKADVNVKVKQEWKDLFSLLKEGFVEEKLVVPQSWFHNVETSFAPVSKSESSASGLPRPSRSAQSAARQD